VSATLSRPTVEYLTAGTLSVEQSHVEVDGREHAVDEPKTARSRRTLPLPTDVATALRELKTRQKRGRLAVGVAFDESSHVCSHEDGTPVLPRTFTGWFHRIRVEAQLPRITLRNLRHSSVSVMLHAGIPGRGRQPGRRGSNQQTRGREVVIQIWSHPKAIIDHRHHKPRGESDD